MTAPKKNTAALYARFSSEMQKDRSIEDQFSICENYAKRDGFKIVARFSDRAKSGASLFDRDGLMDLRNAAKRGEFSAVIVEGLDRLSRDQEDLAGLFKRLNHYGIQVFTISEGLVTDIHVGIRGITGALFLKDLAQKVRRGHLGRVSEGLVPGSLAYGYDLVLGKPGVRVINEAQATAVRRIFTEYADGGSPREIADGLTRDGVASPRGSAWSHQIFIGGGAKKGMLRNRLYIGEIVWNAFHTVRDPESGNKLKRKNPEHEHRIVQAPQLRIVDQKLWDAAQAVAESRAMTRRKVKPVNIRNREHFLTGLLRCGSCQGNMRIAGHCRGKSTVACAAAYQYSTCHHRKSYNIEKLKDLVLTGFRDNLLDPGPIKEAVSAYHERYQANEKKHSGERLTAERQINRLTLQIDRLVTAISDSDDPLPALLASLKAKETERVGLQERVRLLSATNVIALHPNVIETYKGTVAKLHEALTSASDPARARAAFHNLVDSIIVHPTDKRMPYEISVYGRLSAMMGVDLFPTMRSNAEIIAAEALPAAAIQAKLSPQGCRYSSMGQVVSLGRWRAAAA